MAVSSGGKPKSEWLCIDCGKVLGYVLGGELTPAVEGKYCRTRGPNLEVTCPTCEFRKVFYTSDPIVRAIYQLVDAIATLAARRMVEQATIELLEREKRSKE